MRQNSTKFSTAYYRTAVRRKGTPVGKVYTIDPRPPITAFWGYNRPNSLPEFFAFTKDFVNWWTYIPDGFWIDNIWAAFKAQPLTGKAWNEGFFVPVMNQKVFMKGQIVDTVPTWFDVNPGVGSQRGPWGAFPETWFDSITT